MNQILIIETSPRGSVSASRAATQKLSVRLHEEFPEAKFVYRDLTKESIPHLDDSTLKAIASKIPEEVQANKESAHLSDQLTEELLASDLLVIASPMWNFGIPSLLKAWIDLVVRPGKTFSYAESGVLGLAKNKKAVLVLSSGGVFSEGPWKQSDFVEPYLRQVLGFIGIDDVQTIRAEGLNISQLAENAVPNAEKAIAKLAL
ncbi:FMN-dependent NADH-azoreductase [Paenibacillus sp. NPDC058071]|uniref:FMN-dependent NADH-azoreductase n=1 Tax=Paenibacillus sp. NPDC058071 TaxID=3346326 RepID=UPI0036DD19D6